MEDKKYTPNEDDIQLAALHHRSTMGWHVTGAIACLAVLAGMEIYFQRTYTLAIAIVPIVQALVYGYQERKRNGQGQPPK